MKNVEINIKQSDGTYEVLYPKINAQISVDILNDYNKYWWRKETNTDTYEIEQTLNSEKTMILCNSSVYGSWYLYYADEIEIVDEVHMYIKLKGQINSIHKSITNTTNVSELLAPAIGKYCAFCGDDRPKVNDIIYEYDYTKVDKNLLLTQETVFSKNYNSSAYGGYAVEAKNYYVLSIKTNYNSSNIEYIQSENANTYPVSFDELYSVVPDKLYEGQEFGLRDMSSSNDYLDTDEFMITDGEKVSLPSPSQTKIRIGTQYDGYMSENDIQIIKGRYVTGGESYSGYISEGNYYIPEDAIVKWGYISSESSLKSIIINKYYTVKIIKNNSLHYTSLGNVLEKLKTCPNCEYGRYMGTGTQFLNLNFSFVPKLVFVFSHSTLTINSESKRVPFNQLAGLSQCLKTIFINSLDGIYGIARFDNWVSFGSDGNIKAYFKGKTLQIIAVTATGDTFGPNLSVLGLYNKVGSGYGYFALG